MIGNVIDKRKRRYRWRKITAIFEPTWHDNSCKDSDQAPKQDYEGVGYHEIGKTSVMEAMHYGVVLPYTVTVYIYDLGEGIKVSKRGRKSS